jgi:integrase
VKEKVARMQVDAATGRFVPDSDVLLEHFLIGWLERHRPDWKPTTYSSYRDIVHKHILPILGSIRLQEVTRVQVARMLELLLTRGTQHPDRRNYRPGGLSFRTVRYVHRVLSHAYRDAVDDKLVRDNPCAGALPKRPREEAMHEAAAKNPFVARYLDIQNPSYRVNRTLDMDEVIMFLSFLQKIGSTMYIPALMTIGLGGLRRGELLAATWKQLFIEEKRFVVARSLSFTTESRLNVNLPKSATSIRVVPVPDSLITVLKKVRLEQARMKLMMGEAYHDNDLIVCRKDGSFYNPNGFTASWRKATKKFEQATGIPSFTHHAMRSTLASFYTANGLSDIVASKSLGHSSTQVTQDYYLRPVEAELQRAAQMVEERVMRRII